MMMVNLDDDDDEDIDDDDGDARSVDGYHDDEVDGDDDDVDQDMCDHGDDGDNDEDGSHDRDRPTIERRPPTSRSGSGRTKSQVVSVNEASSEASAIEHVLATSAAGLDAVDFQVATGAPPPRARVSSLHRP